MPEEPVYSKGGEIIKLNRTKLWILSNQYRILEVLHPAEADSYARHHQALERGYELHYNWMAEPIYDCGFPKNLTTSFPEILATWS